VDLYLVRHAVAHQRDPDRWPDDSERPLTPEGEEEFRAVARELGRMAPGVQAILSSPYARAWRTAEILAETTSWPVPKPFPPLEPETPPSEVVEGLGPYAEADCLALVGHRPCIHELAAYLLTGDPKGLDIKIKKGGAVCIRFGGEAGAGKLRWLLTPQMLRS
jgi:phosphohistidine phosphatase